MKALDDAERKIKSIVIDIKAGKIKNYNELMNVIETQLTETDKHLTVAEFIIREYNRIEKEIQEKKRRNDLMYG